jgi:signal transduction histidine kinase
MLRNLYYSWKKIPVRIRGTIIISIPIGYLFTSLIAFAWLKASLVEDEAWVQHTQKVRLETKRLLTALVDAETGVRGYGLTRRDAFLTPYNQASAVIPDSLTKLKNLVQDNIEQTQRLEEIRGFVKADADLLRLAVVNLLSNACRYTNAGGKVWLRLFKKSDRAIVQVEDTGIGIPPEALAHIFERFYRVDQTRRKVQGGFGLGLAIAQQIIQAHNGEITVSSKLGVGSIFQLSLPLEIANYQTAVAPVNGQSK